jgi:hypothetical protein
MPPVSSSAGWVRDSVLLFPEPGAIGGLTGVPESAPTTTAFPVRASPLPSEVRKTTPVERVAAVA